jgi:hypothetical protein
LLKINFHEKTLRSDRFSPICHFYSQSLIGNINSGEYLIIDAYDRNYVVPDDPDQQNSGTLGMLYQTVLDVLGVTEVVVKQDKVIVYPNPTADYVTLQISLKKIHGKSPCMICPES